MNNREKDIKSEFVQINGKMIEVFSFNTIVVGTGAAGFNAADRLHSYGQKDIAIVTEGINAGTSRNTGSDKQTYYKLTLSGGDSDSVLELAQTLYKGQCVDGDIALAEAALSAQSFLKLADLGVPFPVSRYGEYIGYKTDHDPRRRATSAGPLTSKLMTEALERSVKSKNIKIFDGYQVISVLVKEDKVYGLLCLDLNGLEDQDSRFVAFNCKNVIYATGGPAGMYADSVFPFGHYGATGLAFEAGVFGKNLTEWQYGLASVKPRWNVSGTYMQVLPRFISTDAKGGDEREFLQDFFVDQGELLTKVFLKGYEWPFDVRKVATGSSIVDILVYIECCIKGRKVFLDFRSNPLNQEVDFSLLSTEAREYLEKAGATFGTPIERLLHMNTPAVDFYKSKGVDLTREPLEIALGAQHNNGGLGIDKWWQTNIEGFFAAGEASASHGVYRPGGSALNAGQVGSTRAAQYIARNCQGDPAADVLFTEILSETAAKTITLCDAIICSENNVSEIWDNAAKRMSRVGAAIRDKDGIIEALGEIINEYKTFADRVKIDNPKHLAKACRLYDVLICQLVYLSAMVDYADQGGKSRGSALYYDKDGTRSYESLPEIFRFTLDDNSRGDLVQEAVLTDGACQLSWRKIRPIPIEDDFFENVWRNYRENGNVY
jgi:succinate dehydrogenase / fumarate reductase flavoprotein subunit